MDIISVRLLAAGQIAVKVDIHSVGQPNGQSAVPAKGIQTPSKPAAKLTASSARAIHANGTMSKAAPSKGKPILSKGAQKQDPAEVQRNRQLAEEEEVK